MRERCETWDLLRGERHSANAGIAGLLPFPLGSLVLQLLSPAPPLPVGAAKTRAARGAFGVLQSVLAQAPLQRQAQRLGQPAPGALEAREDRIGLDRVAGAEPRPDEALGIRYPAVVVETLAAEDRKSVV